MTEDVDVRSTPQILSLQIDGDLAGEIDSIARLDGVTRSEILQRLLLSSLRTETQDTSRWVRELHVIEGRLKQIIQKLDDIEADEAATALAEAVEWVDTSIDRLEEFEEEDE